MRTKWFPVRFYEILPAPEYEISDQEEYERMRSEWDTLEKSINELVAQVNISNIRSIALQINSLDLVIGKGLLCKSILKAQTQSPELTDVFATLVALVNSKYPIIGRIVFLRIIRNFHLQIGRGTLETDEYDLSALGKLLAHLINQRVVHVDTAEDLLCFLLNEPSDQNVNLAVGFVTECGPSIQCISPDYIYAYCVKNFDIEHDGELGRKIHGIVMRLFDIITSEAQSRPPVHPELDLVDERDQTTHFYSFLIAVEPLNSLDTFSSSFFINRETSSCYMS